MTKRNLNRLWGIGQGHGNWNPLRVTGYDDREIKNNISSSVWSQTGTLMQGQEGQRNPQLSHVEFLNNINDGGQKVKASVT